MKRKKQKIKTSIIIPTNGRRPEMLNQVLDSIRKQINLSTSEIIIMSEGKSVLKAGEIMWGGLPVKEYITPKGNGIFNNFSDSLRYACGEYLLFLDDDIVLMNVDLIFKLEKFLDSHSNVWGVGPFIDESRDNAQNFLSIIEDKFKKTFRLWDPDDYTNAIYSCYGKGSANHNETLPREPFIGCQWLTNQALLIRKEVFAKYHKDDLDVFNQYHSIERIWAVDFYMTHRLYVKNKDALAFHPDVKVLHLGARSTSFNKNDRILRETICGMYYYKRFLGSQGFVKAYVIPNIGRIIHITIDNRANPINLVYSLSMYVYSFLILLSKRSQLKGIVAYE